MIQPSTLIPLPQHRLVLALALVTLITGCSNDRVAQQTKQPPPKPETTIQPQNNLEEVVVSANESTTKQQGRATNNSGRPPHKQNRTINPKTYDAANTPAINSLPAAKRAAVADASVISGMVMREGVATIYYPTEHVDRESYVSETPNPVQRVDEQPVSTFSIDVDTAAYSNARRMLTREGRLPPAAAVKAEEFINYFRYNYPAPDDSGIPFSIHTELAPTPWNADTQLLKIGLQGYQVSAEQRPASNLVFLIDVSGSMRSPFKLDLVKQSLRMLVKQMRTQDRIALVVYAGAAGLALESTTGNDKARILAAIDALEAGGSTNGGAGIQLAYQVARQHFIPEGVNRVLIASDGDMNVGITDREALKGLVKRQREQGVALTTLGFGSGNYNYALMEQLADVGNGSAVYIDSLKEAHKVLVKEVNSTLQTIARDVKIQIEFNPGTVAEYRLIGYENRLLKREDFRNDKIDAGDIGAGHSVTALYEIALKGSGGERIPALRYAKPAAKTEKQDNRRHSDELAHIKLRYKSPTGPTTGENRSREISRSILRSQRLPSLARASDDFRFAAAVAGYAQLLRGGRYTGNWHYADAAELARNAKGRDPHGYRGELVTLVELSETIASPMAINTKQPNR